MPSTLPPLAARAGIDCFMNHCCDPNTDCDWGESDVGQYLVLATKPIRVGDELTCVTTCFEKVVPILFLVACPAVFDRFLSSLINYHCLYFL
jgi:hypothetical protein